MQANERNSGDRSLECCKDCDCHGGFKKVLHLDTGLVIYLHRGRSFVNNEGPVQARQVCPGKDDTFILHNTSQTELENNTAIAELSKYKTKCTTCRTVIHRVRSLLKEITAIRRNETYAVCEHCLSTDIKCKKCEYIVTKFQADKKKQLEERDQRFKLWSCKVKLVLETILKKLKMGCRRLGQETADATELEKLLEELKPPLPRLNETGQAWLENLYQSKDMLQEIILQLKLQGVRKRYSSDDSLYVSLSRVDQGRNTVEDLRKQIPPLEPVIESQPAVKSKSSKEVKSTLPPPPPSPLTSEDRTSTLKSKSSKEGKSTSQHPPDEGKNKSASKSKTSKEVKSPSQRSPETPLTSDGKKSTSKSKPSKEVKPKPSEDTTKSKKAKKDHSVKKEDNDELDFAKLLKKSKEEEKQRAKEQKDLAKKSKEPSPVPKPKKEEIKKPADTFRKKNLEIASILEDDTSDATCKEVTPKFSEEMIKGIKIVPLEERHKTTDTLISSFLEKLKSSVEEKKEMTPTVTQTMVDKEEKKNSGIITYRLSDRKFIENGWTRLPTMKVFRRMNIYKMIPSSSDWFEQHKDKNLLYYGSGETLAQIDIGERKWFYKNGSVALDCRDYDEGTLLPRRYMVYSHEDDSTKAQTILACFDYLGNGIVYDSDGNVRLKYNQSEGIVIDEKIGPPCLWKWHTLNDPPILQQSFVDTYPKNPSPELEEIIRKAKDKKVDEPQQCHSHVHMHPLDTKSKSILQCGRKNDSLLRIELQNYAKKTHSKLEQKFQRLQIRMKAVKINDYFSLRVLDQSKVYLLFRDRALTLKLNLGMLLQSDEIVDVDISDTNNVTTPYDRLPPRSKSFKRVHDAYQAVRASIDSTQAFLTKGPNNTYNISSSTVCPLPQLGVPSNVGTLSPPNWDSTRCNVNLPRWRSVDSYRQVRSSPVHPCSPCPLVTSRNMPCVGSF